MTNLEVMTAFEQVERAVERVRTSTDRSMALLTSRLTQRWATLVVLIKAMQAESEPRTVATDEVMPEDVKEVMEGRRFLARYMETARASVALYDEVLALLDEEESWLPFGEKMLQVAESQFGEAFGKLSLEMGHQEALTVGYINTLADDATAGLHDTLLHLRALLVLVYYDGYEALKPYAVSLKDLLAAIIAGFRSYVAVHGKRIEKQLRHQTNEFRPRKTLPMTPEVWEELSVADDEAVDAATNGVLAESDGWKFITKAEKRRMEDNRKLLERIMLNSIDEEVFNFKDAIEINDLLDDLTAENLEYFYERVHRRNLLQVGMFPHMKEEYEEFLCPTSREADGAEGESEASRWLREMLSKADLYLADDYKAAWLTETVSAAFAAECGDALAADVQNKRRRVKVACMVLGALAEAGVYMPKTDLVLAETLGIADVKAATVARYINVGRHNEERLKYVEWFLAAAEDIP